MRVQRRLLFRPPLLALILAASYSLLPTLAAAQRMPEAYQGPSVAWKSAEGNPSDYTGADRCQSCHKAEFTEFAKTPHARMAVPGKNYIAGCEVCHGPGKAHADAMEEAGGDDTKIAEGLKQHPIFAFHANPKENAARCLNCHISGKHQDFFEQSRHAGAGLSCDQCHTTHLVDAAKDQSKGNLSYPQGYFFQNPRLSDEARWLHNSLLKESEPGLCFSCHGTIQAQFALPVHHRVPEGLMKCTDCHNPHGSFNRASLNQVNWETCVKCHVEKRGPYLYEHPAVRVQGCVICHNPHGTVNRDLLLRREPRQLCLQCHTAFHDQAGVPHGRLGFAPGGECVRCHVTVHGSNFDQFLLK